MPRHHADQAQRNRRHNDKRLHVGTEGNRHQHVHDEQGERHQSAQRIIGLCLLLPLPPERIVEGGVSGRHARQDALLQKRVDLRTRGDAHIDVGRDRNGAATIHPANGGRRPGKPRVGDLPQRNAAPRRPHDITINIGFGIPFFLRKPYVHAHIFPTSLHPQRLHAKKSGARLRRKPIKREGQRSSFRLEFQLNLPETLVQIAAHIENAVDGA